MSFAGSDELLSASTLKLASLVREGNLSPVDLVDLYIARIEAENPALNAVVADRFAHARREAREAADKLAQRSAEEPLPPLFGVPCTVKEGIAVLGMPHTAGVFARKHLRAEQDARVVRRVRDAGAIVLGVTNMPEGGLWLETDNRVYGRTNNPWDLSRIPGGSSGGEAAILAAGASPFGIGSDIAGSIRIPAAMCGVFGHKPTGGLVSNQGYWPDVPGALDTFLCTGPMTRRAEDLWPLLGLMAERALEDQPSAIDLRGVTVYPLETTGAARIRPSKRQAVRRAAAALEARGARIAELRTRGLEKALFIWTAMMEEEAGALTYGEVLGNGRPIRIARELLRAPFPSAPHTVQALIVAGVEALLKSVPAPIATWSTAGKRLREELEAELGPHGVILHPTYTRSAPRHWEPLLTPLDFVCTALFNVLAFPVTQVPAGFDDLGLPLGVQVAGRRNADALTIAVARALEEDLGGWTKARRKTRVPSRATISP
ncbi:amidase [Polyangium sp. y55x31]|uniref:amidase n=1 Tax=Polyangium sp. y55x31 TaxID=3042688 RepID=UPI00248327A8|nr:amidase [Polyangium sp. y55x31]MDI1482375.1 amidase [Polyangium sp. y55x31]